MSLNERPLQGQKPHHHHSLGRVARTSVMWAYLRTGLIALIGIPTAIVLARLLSPADFGIAAAATFFGQLAGRLSSGGMGSALVRIKDLREDHISSIFVINVGLTALCAVSLVAGAPYIGRFYGTAEVGWVMPMVAINYALGGLSMVQQALLTRDLRYRELATIGSADMAVSAVTAVVFAAFGFRYWSLVIGEVCGAFVKWIWGAHLTGWHVRLKFVPEAARELSSFALGSFSRRTVEHFTQNAGHLVVGRFLGTTSLGFYDKAFALANNLYQRMTTVGSSVSFRIFAIIQDEPERFSRAYRKVIMTVTLLGYVAFGAIGTMAPHLIVVAFGETWRFSVVPLQILCASFALKLLNQYAIAASQARGWVWPHVWRQIVQVACIVVGVYLATPWGIDGAAVAVLGATVVMFFLTQTMMRAATGLGWADVLEPQVPAIATSALLVAMLWGADALLSPVVGPPVILAVQMCAAAVFALAFAWWCPFREPRMLMHETVSDLSPRLAQWIWKDIPAARTARPKPADIGTALSPSADTQAVP